MQFHSISPHRVAAYKAFDDILVSLRCIICLINTRIGDVWFILSVMENTGVQNWKLQKEEETQTAETGTAQLTARRTAQFRKFTQSEYG